MTWCALKPWKQDGYMGGPRARQVGCGKSSATSARLFTAHEASADTRPTVEVMQRTKAQSHDFYFRCQYASRERVHLRNAHIVGMRACVAVECLSLHTQQKTRFRRATEWGELGGNTLRPGAQLIPEIGRYDRWVFRGKGDIAVGSLMCGRTVLCKQYLRELDRLQQLTGLYLWKEYRYCSEAQALGMVGYIEGNTFCARNTAFGEIL